MTMTDADFWKAVESVNWDAVKKEKSSTVKARLVKVWSLEFTKEFRDIMRAKHSLLYKKIEKWEKYTDKSCSLGDDSFGDLIDHIIGLGEKEFTAVMENPELAYNRAVKHAFTESFSYVIPYEDDYKVAADPMAHFAEFAGRIKPDLVALHEHPVLSGHVFPDLSGLLADLSRVENREKPKLSAKTVLALMEDVENSIQQVEKTMKVKLIIREDPSGFGYGNFNPHGCINLYNDMAEAELI